MTVVGEREFIEKFASFFGLNINQVSMSSSLTDDLGFDSVMLLEVAVMLDDFSDSPIPDDLLASLESIADVYHYYVQFASRR